MTRISVAEARRDFADVLNRAAYGHERIMITRRDSEVAAIVPIEELRLLDVLLERYEAEADLAEARETLLEAREHSIAWNHLKRELDL